MSVGVTGPVALTLPPSPDRYPGIVLEVQGPRLRLTCACELPPGSAVLLESGSLAMLGEVIASRALDHSTEAVIELDQAILASADLANLARRILGDAPERREASR